MGRRKKLDALKSLEVMLLSIATKVEGLECEKKDSPYLKLAELFFKGIDLRQKLINSTPQEPHSTMITTVSGLDIDKI